MLSQHHKDIVKSTVPVLRESGVALTEHFYKRMLNGNPELKNIFNLSNQAHGRQPRALAAAVLAYAENIEDPSKLVKAIERIALKHVAVDIHPEHYPIVGENLLHSISEVLNLPMDHEIIEAWGKAYQQLADILINREQHIYHHLAEQVGGWAGWRDFVIADKRDNGDSTTITLSAADGAAIMTGHAGQRITVKVPVATMGIEQPQNFNLIAADTGLYRFEVKSEPTEDGIPSVSNIVINDLKIGDTVKVTAPFA